LRHTPVLLTLSGMYLTRKFEIANTPMVAHIKYTVFNAYTWSDWYLEYHIRISR
jgi:hypothetical protein